VTAIRGVARHEAWRMTEPFVIAGHRYDNADVVVVELADGRARGRGEATPTAYYGETVDSVLAQADAMIAALRDESWDVLHDRMLAGAARNAVDCAIWDLRAKRAGRPAWALAGLQPPAPIATAMTLSIDTPALMAARAAACGHAVIKLKLGEGDDLARVAAVRAAVPAAQLVVDANQAWDIARLADLMPALAALGVAMVEQPLPPERDADLRDVDHLVPICADESSHLPDDLDELVGAYDIVNLKLDKTGGFTEALRFTARARQLGFGLMVGCMEGTSLAMAPALLLAGDAVLVDLDGPLLIGSDRPDGLHYADGMVHPPLPALWG
jgi:L-alanine-DL-glutamate epimerase-like enolase superfamily enzyme